jgi:hypothetical protein
MSEFDPFEDLLGATELGTKQIANETLEWEGPIPASAHKYAEALLTQGKDGAYTSKAVVKVSEKERALKLAAAVRAAVKERNGAVSLTSRHIYAEDGSLASISLTVGERRGKKA